MFATVAPCTLCALNTTVTVSMPNFSGHHLGYGEEATALCGLIIPSLLSMVVQVFRQASESAWPCDILEN